MIILLCPPYFNSLILVEGRGFKPKFLVIGLTSLAFSQKLSSNSGMSEVSMSESGIVLIYSSRLGEILIILYLCYSVCD